MDFIVGKEPTRKDDLEEEMEKIRKVELTSEEKKKIYLEEKARIEARERIKQEIKERRKEKPKLYKSGLLWFVVIVLIMAGMQKSMEDSGSIIGGVGGLVLFSLLLGRIIDTIKAKITKREVVSQVNIKKWFWVGIVFLVIGMVITRTNESSNVLIEPPSKSVTSSSESTEPKWIHPRYDNLRTSVELYYGSSKMYVGQILGKNDKYVDLHTGLKFKGVKILKKGGLTEWKSRDEIVGGDWYIKADDPAIKNPVLEFEW
ncbi:MAG: hypothetical protein V1749_11235 [Candidatus Desantisbacteria bacterium]